MRLQMNRKIVKMVKKTKSLFLLMKRLRAQSFWFVCFFEAGMKIGKIKVLFHYTIKFNLIEILFLFLDLYLQLDFNLEILKAIGFLRIKAFLVFFFFYCKEKRRLKKLWSLLLRSLFLSCYLKICLIWSLEKFEMCFIWPQETTICRMSFVYSLEICKTCLIWFL